MFMAAPATAHTENPLNSFSELGALGALPLANEWDSTLIIVSVSAFLLAKAAWYSGSAIRSCFAAWARMRRR